PTLRPERASATARLAARVDFPTPPLPDPTAMIRRFTLSAIIATRTSAMPSRPSSRARASASIPSRSAADNPPASRTMVAASPVILADRRRCRMGSVSRLAIFSMSFMEALLAQLAPASSENRVSPLFLSHFSPITAGMEKNGGFVERIGLFMAGKRGPWGGPPRGDDGQDPEGSEGEGGEPKGDPSRGPRNPWLPPGDDTRRSASVEDIFKQRGPEGPRRRGGGPGGPNFRIPRRPGGKSWLPIGLGVAAVLWRGVSTIHFVQPREHGLVSWFGSKYSYTLQPGTNLPLPWPIPSVEVQNVSEIRRDTIGDGGENLILTGDQNLVDLSYIVRWNIKDLVRYKFALAEPDESLREAAEA